MAINTGATTELIWSQIQKIPTLASFIAGALASIPGSKADIVTDTPHLALSTE
jgi:hypothetical protein